MANHHHHHHTRQHEATVASTNNMSWITAHVFAIITVALLLRQDWALRWTISGAPLLTYCILVAGHRRVLPFIPVWPLAAYINLAYALASTSWLFYWIFTAACYPSIFLASLFQFRFVSNVLRRRLRALLRELHFTADKISFFDLPALEIDRDVDGLMVIRGLTVSLSSLTIVAHGVEVGIKFSDDMEMALVVDTVTIKLFRRIDIGDVYGNVKGGEHEMTFHKLAPRTKNANGEAMMNRNIFEQGTPLLNAAAAHQGSSAAEKVLMTEEMTDHSAPNQMSADEALKQVKPLNLDDQQASDRYTRTMQHIEKTSAIHQSREDVKHKLKHTQETNLDESDRKGMRAAICSRLHVRPSVPHPPKHSIKVTTLQNLSPPYVRRFLHRLPLLLRLLLNPIAYFHPVFIQSITAGASGKWAQSMIEQKVFGSSDNPDIKSLQRRISAWLSEANFCVQLVDIQGVAQVPVNVAFEILNQLKFDDVLVYRTVPEQVKLKEVVRIGGADAAVSLPSYLLPHHEHLLPAPPSEDDMTHQAEERDKADGKPKEVQAQRALEQTRKDETSVTISTHVRLPACFDQELLDFIAALVKATKIVEIDRDADELAEHNSRGIREMTHAAKETFKTGLKKATVEAVANDHFIAKLVGKLTKKLETAQGDLGYSGAIPVPLAVYRSNAEPYSKLLP